VLESWCKICLDPVDKFADYAANLSLSLSFPTNRHNHVFQDLTASRSLSWSPTIAADIPSTTRRSKSAYTPSSLSGMEKKLKVQCFTLFFVYQNIILYCSPFCPTISVKALNCIFVENETVTRCSRDGRLRPRCRHLANWTKHNACMLLSPSAPLRENMTFIYKTPST